jgi:hypothetical protein
MTITVVLALWVTNWLIIAVHALLSVSYMHYLITVPYPSCIPPFLGNGGPQKARWGSVSRKNWTVYKLNLPLLVPQQKWLSLLASLLILSLPIGPAKDSSNLTVIRRIIRVGSDGIGSAQRQAVGFRFRSKLLRCVGLGSTVPTQLTQQPVDSTTKLNKNGETINCQHIMINTLTNARIKSVCRVAMKAVTISLNCCGLTDESISSRTWALFRKASCCVCVYVTRSPVTLSAYCAFRRQVPHLSEFQLTRKYSTVKTG